MRLAAGGRVGAGRIKVLVVAGGGLTYGPDYPAGEEDDERGIEPNALFRHDTYSNDTAAPTLHRTSELG